MQPIIAEVLFQCLPSPCVVCAYQLTFALYYTMTNHFRVTVLFKYPWDMDHESDAKTKNKLCKCNVNRMKARTRFRCNCRKFEEVAP